MSAPFDRRMIPAEAVEGSWKAPDGHVIRRIDWTPPQPCQAWAEEVSRAAPSAWAPIDVVSYPGAYHGFDGEAPLRLRRDVPNGVNRGQGVHVGGDPLARRLSLERLDAWLARFERGA